MISMTYTLRDHDTGKEFPVSSQLRENGDAFTELADKGIILSTSRSGEAPHEPFSNSPTALAFYCALQAGRKV